ncbi:3-hydroxyisobutyryl-CoA hydrolase, mitochondrial-like [Prorops nasuta]|uniref:3-hydroxyisobutyryl-CoA hydrolase, mitochondrial-like n=1 Tax=Prorops nasuta TaxID=863751 RepID=UPI0034CDD3AD
MALHLDSQKIRAVGVIVRKFATHLKPELKVSDELPVTHTDLKQLISSRKTRSDLDWVCGTNNDILFEDCGHVGVITLNRPSALNALNFSMVNKITSTLKHWETTKKLVIVEGAGDQAFCAGGDLKLIDYLHLPDGVDVQRQFFQAQYSLNYLVGTYKIPYIALINNLTMGGGVGISANGMYRVATEKTVLCMPETALGLCPDVGSTHFLSRLPSRLGHFFGLTGYRLKGVDVLHTGLATHYVPSERLMDLKEDLLRIEDSNVSKVLRSHQVEPEREFSLKPYLEKIDYCFSAATMEEVVARLEADGSNWAKKTLKTLAYMSPNSLKLTKMSLERGRTMSLAECLKMEYRLNISIIQEKHDIYEGIGSAVYVKNHLPSWRPKTLAEVTNESLLRRFESQDPKHQLDL